MNLTVTDSPVRIGTGTGWALISASFLHTLAIKTDGSLWAWGDNYYGQLGDGSSENYRAAPVPVGRGTDWAAVAAGDAHTVALRYDGSLWAWGSNSHGQLGDGTTTGRTYPVRIGTANIWTAVAAGDAHTLALMQDGTLWAWGYNWNGQLGDGSSENYRSAPVRVGNDSDWRAVAAGGYHTVALKTDGTLWAWGNNYLGQLGDGTTTDRDTPVCIGSMTDTDWASVTAGGFHTLALKTDGTLWAWGNNGSGQLGIGSNTNTSAPARVGSENDWATVAACGSCTVALKTGKSLWAWGYNEDGQLGIGSTTNTNRPARVGTDSDWAAVAAGGHTVALKQDNSLWAWGYNWAGQLGDGTTADKNVPTRIGQASDWAIISAGGSHTVALKTDGTLLAWGWNSSGQLGNGTLMNRAAPVRAGAGAIVTGEEHTVALRPDGSLWAWGWNDYGRLGLGGGVARSDRPTRVGTDTDWAAVAAGETHTVALKTDGTLWTWGYNGDGLGDGSTTSTYAPMRVGPDNDWAAVAAGNRHTMALKQDGSLWAWGNNYYGQLGIGSNTNTNAPARVGLDTGWAAVVVGWDYTVAVKQDGTLWAWGENNYGQLGIGSTGGSTNAPARVGTADDWASVAAGMYHTAALKQDGTLWAWGYNSWGQLGIGSNTNTNAPARVGTDTDWAAVTAGEGHAMALKLDNSLWAWGYNGEGQLGIGSRPPYSTNTPMRVGTATDWAVIAAGRDHTAAFKQDGSLWTWGWYYEGGAVGRRLSPECVSVIPGVGVWGVMADFKKDFAVTIAPVSLGVAVNAPDLIWTTGGDAPWFTQSAETNKTPYAAQSGLIGDNQSTWIETTVTSPGTLSFGWRVLSAFTHVLSYSINGVTYDFIHGPFGSWTERRNISLVAGDTIRWTYSKGASGVPLDGADCGWLAEVVWTPDQQTHTTTTPPVPFTWLAQYYGPGDAAFYEAKARAKGDNDYLVWESYVAGLVPTNAASRFGITNFVVNAQSKVTKLEWGPRRSDRVYTVYGKDTLLGSWYTPTNNATRFFKVEVKME